MEDTDTSTKAVVSNLKKIILVLSECGHDGFGTLLG